MRRTTRFLLATALAAGCDLERRPSEGPPASFPPLPFMYELARPFPSTVVDTTASPEARQWTFTTDLTVDSVGTFFRNELAAKRWDLRGDNRTAEEIALYARRGRQTMWVRVTRDPAGRTRYMMIGSVATQGSDTLAVDVRTDSAR